MKRLSILIGLLLVPAQVMATDPLSPWVQEVLNRANAGISMASGLASGGCPDDSAPERKKTHAIENLAIQANDAIRPYIDVQKQIALQSQVLRQRTACLQNDMYLLETKLTEIQQEATAAIATCNSNRLAALLQNYAFTAEAAISLVRGGIDPEFADDRLRYRYAFTDADMWNSSTMVEPMDAASAATQPLCPYTTDYSPRSVAYETAPDGTVTQNVKSYGCDLTVLQGFGDTSEQPEINPLNSFLYATNTFASSVGDMISQFTTSMNQAIGTLRGMPVPGGPQPPLTPPDHGVQTGCMKPAFLQPYSVPYKDILLNAFPGYFSSSGTPGTPTLPMGMLLLPSFDFFSVNSNPFMLLETYVERRNEQGQSRPDPAGSSFVGGYFGADIEDARRMRELQRRTANIEREAAFVDALGRDSLERMSNAFLPLTVAVNVLADSVHGKAPDGAAPSSLPNFTEPIGVVPRYVADLTYFLSRQCVDGFCSQPDGTLDSVSKRIHNPYCTPYISGAYADDRTYAKCFCIPQDADHPNGLDTGGADKDFYDKYCLAGFDAADYDGLPQILYPACQVNGTNM